MKIGLDSATPPTVAQATAAKTAGISLWNGYLSEIPQRDGLYRPWSRAEFDVARILSPMPIAYTSGWDNPTHMKAMAADWQVRLCLDVERLIRDDGPWVQPWLDASGAGLYGVRSVHVNRRAAFHIAAWYPGNNPQSTYPVFWESVITPCGWQWQNTHTEFGVSVDRGYYDDVFAQGATEMIKDLPVSDLEFLGQLVFRSTVGRNASQPDLDGIVSALKNDPANEVYARYSNGPEATAWQKKLQATGAPVQVNLSGATFTAQGTID